MLGALAEAGEALDMVCVGPQGLDLPAEHQALVAWVGAGGVLVCVRRTTILAVAAPSSAPSVSIPLEPP